MQQKLNNPSTVDFSAENRSNQSSFEDDLFFTDKIITDKLA